MTFFQRLWSSIFGTEVHSTHERAQPSNWCLVGNVVEEHVSVELNAKLYGSKHFLPGTKVYCLPPQWGDGYERAIVVGLCRKSRRLITVVMLTNLITNWRAKVVYKQTILDRLREGYKQFSFQWRSQQHVEEWVIELQQRQKSKSKSG